MSQEAGPLILVVDDFEDNRMLYATYLSTCGFRVAEAVDGLDAVEKATTLVPDAIVMDLALPGIDGWEATRRLKEAPATSHIRIVALTGHSLESHAARAREVRCDAFLVKPCLPDKLVETLRALLAR
jgi:two-component system, cell cycle response regulator DivK